MKSSRPRQTPSRISSPALAFGLLAVAFFFIGFVRVAALIPTEHIYMNSSQVLGDSDEDKADEEREKQAEAEREAAKKAAEVKKEAQKNENPGQRMKIQPKEMEIETATGAKVKTKIEDDGRRKIEIERDKLKFKLETQERKIATAGSEKVRRPEIEIEDESDEDAALVRIATDGGKPSLSRRRIEAHSDFPLSIDPTTNTLVVTTPNGTKAVTVLPDQAIENLLSRGFVSTSSAMLTPSGSGSATIRLTEKNGRAVYEVKAKKRFRIFGVIPVETPTTVNVSTEDGQVLSQERSLLTEIVDFLSP